MRAALARDRILEAQAARTAQVEQYRPQFPMTPHRQLAELKAEEAREKDAALMRQLHKSK
jgi:hypothetical protein